VFFEKWDLPAAEIGQVTDDGLLHFYMNGELEATIPAYELVLGGVLLNMTGPIANRLI